MIRTSVLPLREARGEDRQALAHLIHFGAYVHVYQDWRAPLSWLGRQPFLVLEANGQPAAVLACPPDPPETAWLRLFACRSPLSPSTAWEALWPAVCDRLPAGTTVAVVGMETWLRPLLTAAGFHEALRVVLLRRETGPLPPPPDLPAAWRLRPMQAADLPAVHAIDWQAFAPPWRYSGAVLQEAFQQAALATVVEGPEGVLGFQISSASPLGAHLARLAVHPRAQGQGIGKALVHHMLRHFQQSGAYQVTVNTQTDNHASLHVYRQAGFRRTQNEYPIYLYRVP